MLVTCTSKTFRLCAACIDTDRTLIYTWKCFAVFSCLRRASLPSVDSAAILLLSSPVAEQYLTVEDGPLSPPGFRQQSSVAEHFLAVEDGFVSLPSILSQSSVNEQFLYCVYTTETQNGNRSRTVPRNRSSPVYTIRCEPKPRMRSKIWAGKNGRGRRSARTLILKL